VPLGEWIDGQLGPTATQLSFLLSFLEQHMLPNCEVAFVCAISRWILRGSTKLSFVVAKSNNII